MLDNPEATQPKQEQREVAIEVGNWVPNDENISKETGIKGEFITISGLEKVKQAQGKYIENVAAGEHFVITRRYLHTDGIITAKSFDASNREIPQTVEFKKINGRIEIEPRFKRPVLKYTEISLAVPVAPVAVAKK